MRKHAGLLLSAKLQRRKAVHIIYISNFQPGNHNNIASLLSLDSFRKILEEGQGSFWGQAQQ